MSIAKEYGREEQSVTRDGGEDSLGYTATQDPQKGEEKVVCKR